MRLYLSHQHFLIKTRVMIIFMLDWVCHEQTQFGHKVSKAHGWQHTKCACLCSSWLHGSPQRAHSHNHSRCCRNKLTWASSEKQLKHFISLSSLQTSALFEMIEKMQVRWRIGLRAWYRPFELLLAAKLTYVSPPNSAALAAVSVHSVPTDCCLWRPQRADFSLR